MDYVDAQAELGNHTEQDAWKKAQLKSSGCTEVRYYNLILTYKSGFKMIKSAGVCEFSSDHAMESRSVLTVAYLRAHPPNLNSSNHLQLDQVLVFAIVCDHLYSANSGSAYDFSDQYCCILFFHIKSTYIVSLTRIVRFPAPKT